MKKQLLTGLFTVFALAASAQSNEWRNPQVNAVNRAPMHTNYFAYENADAAKKGLKESSANYMTLNGTWKFNWVKDADARPMDFWKTTFNDKGWDGYAGSRRLGIKWLRRPYLCQCRLCMAQPV